MCLDVLALRHNKVRTETHPYSFHKINIREPFIATQPLVVKKRVDSRRSSMGKEVLSSPYHHSRSAVDYYNDGQWQSLQQ